MGNLYPTKPIIRTSGSLKKSLVNPYSKEKTGNETNMYKYEECHDDEVQGALEVSQSMGITFN